MGLSPFSQDPILFVECTRTEECARVLRELREQVARQVGNGDNCKRVH